MIRRIKLAYEIYNFFHKKELIHNRELYKMYGLNKKYYSSISSEDFAQIDPNKFLKNKAGLEIEDDPFFQNLDSFSRESIKNFQDLGYCIIRNFWSEDLVESINHEIEQLLEENKIQFKYGNRIMFAIHKSDILKKACQHHVPQPLMDYLIGGNAQLFQSINFLNGSEQKTHSDSIHMTTFPEGGLLGVWIALEDIDQENGPIHYYPKSHKLPYYMNRDYDNIGNRFLLGNKGYKAYEEMIEGKIREKKIEKKIFEAKKGDMLIWHANLLHGGEPHTNKNRSRKSLVLHHFDSNRICYHEITQRPALIKKA